MVINVYTTSSTSDKSSRHELLAFVNSCLQKLQQEELLVKQTGVKLLVLCPINAALQLFKHLAAYRPQSTGRFLTPALESAEIGVDYSLLFNDLISGVKAWVRIRLLEVIMKEQNILKNLICKRSRRFEDEANLTRIEELSTGAAYCQLTDLLFRGSIPLKKVKWNSRTDVDCLHNWRLLQFAWKELGVNKVPYFTYAKQVIPVERLVCAKFQDNFEFLQWFKKFFDANYDRTPYDALTARNWEMLPPGSSSKTKLTLKNTKAIANDVPPASTRQRAPQQTKMPQNKGNLGISTKGGDIAEDATTIDDATDFQIRMLEDRCKRLVSNVSIGS
ncbi:unnamed protein product [Enterobius vermicularis]|uniref:Calponin-homology (CH) domain-containing protein n=1 Tax=Enterobius vermicularis TaxID=51028 RepID=A0A0N4VH26_ENTVE|nr:unnamed protein product [Enterobius vermicularis]